MSRDRVVDGVKYTKRAYEELSGYKTCARCGLLKPVELFGKVPDKAIVIGKPIYRPLCKSCHTKRSIDYYNENRETKLEYQKKLNILQRDTYLEKRNAQKRDYSARKRKATPPWLSKEHRRQIKDTHLFRKSLTLSTGVQHRVDHIVPFGNPYVCGLHVPWNLQVIPKTGNASKHNSIDNDRLKDLYPNYAPFVEDVELIAMLESSYAQSGR